MGSRARQHHVASQQIRSDSIDVFMPGQRIRELHAVRGAFAFGQPDTTRFKADTVDWLRGDTIVAKFDTAIARDTTRSAQIKELVAQGSARSYYHTAPGDTAMRKAAINYVNGKQINVAFAQGKTQKVTVRERVSGVYLEPKPDTKAATKTAPVTKTSAPTKTAPTTTAAPPRPPAKPDQ